MTYSVSLGGRWTRAAAVFAVQSCRNTIEPNAHSKRARFQSLCSPIAFSRRSVLSKYISVPSRVIFTVQTHVGPGLVCAARVNTFFGEQIVSSKMEQSKTLEERFDNNMMSTVILIVEVVLLKITNYTSELWIVLRKQCV